MPMLISGWISSPSSVQEELTLELALSAAAMAAMKMALKN
jgi:hypothetical protein